MANRFHMHLTAGPEHIDVMGHVNNAVWVQWMEAIATAHWQAEARPEDVARYVWVVVRHEIDYKGNIREGQSVVAETVIPDAPHGARFDRCVEFRLAGADGAPTGKPLVQSRTTWAMIDLESGRLSRIPAEVAAPFSPEAGWPSA